MSAILIWAVFSLLWLQQRRTQNATAVDAAWALGIGLQTAFLAWSSGGLPLRRVVIAGLVGIWSLRLAGYLYFNRVRTGVEDGRYARFRREWNPAVFYLFYMVQGLLVFLLPLTFRAALGSGAPFPSRWDAVGLGLWAVALLGESLADRQLARFRADPANRGKTCRVGLWRTSRHPNYFFEWLLWCAYVPMSLGAPGGAWSLAGPLLLLVLLTKVSGIPPTEAQALVSRGDDYRDYQRTTSAFVPWFPRTGARP
ncbi:MAG: DUF1295 domain-containing protein [Elusimicrobia bacterium]|nr:DUF1295 domain-containing protein [Elusimicrobiota bacterium]